MGGNDLDVLESLEDINQFQDEGRGFEGNVSESSPVWQQPTHEDTQQMIIIRNNIRDQLFNQFMS